MEATASINPANQEVIGYVQRSNEDDLNEAVKAAEDAQKEWKKLSGLERGGYLLKSANILENKMEDIAASMTKEMGKTYAESKGETARGAAILKYFAGEGVRKVGEVIPSNDSSTFMYSKRVPVGVVGVIAPWNFPVAIPLRKMAPAIIYGNTAVFKPDSETVVTSARIVESFEKAGLPEGVINLITGGGSVIGEGMIHHPGIKAITFTGSNTVGQRVAKGAAARGAKFQLEMGGKNPLIITKNADLDAAVEATLSGGLKSTGQKCTCTSRVIVESDVYEMYKHKLLRKVSEIKVGDGMDEATWMGSCANKKQLETIKDYIQKGLDEGASLIFGGDQPDEKSLNKGFYLNPTVFDEVTTSMVIEQEEIFGPVLALMKVNSLKEAIDVANDTKYGLSASIFTQDITSILEFIDDIDAGLIRVNSETAGVELQAPFGGMKNSSSHSREQGQAAKEFFTNIKTVSIKG